MPRKQDIAPYLVPYSWQRSVLPTGSHHHLLKQVKPPLSSQDSSIFPSVGLNHFLGQEFLPGVGISFFLFCPREVMRLSQHREDQFFLNVFSNLWSSTLNSMEVEVLGMVYNWKCTCFPSLSLWASSWFYHCLSQQFSALPTCS